MSAFTYLRTIEAHSKVLVFLSSKVDVCVYLYFCQVRSIFVSAFSYLRTIEAHSKVLVFLSSKVDVCVCFHLLA